MATGAPFRLVRCPKCRLLLPELPNVPVYRCGGCGALLQAKNQKKDTKKTEVAQQEANVELMNESNNVLECKEAVKLNDKEKVYSDCSEDCNNAEDRNGYRNREGGDLGAVDSSSNDSHFGSEDFDMEGPRIESDVYSSTELVHNKTAEPLPSPEAKPEEEEAENEYIPIVETDNSLAEAEVERRVSSAVAAVVSAPREQSNENGVQGIDSMRSRGTCGFTEFGSPSSEFSCMVRDDDESKSPTARGSHAYDASISSYEELQHQYVRATHHKAPNFATPREEFRRDQFLVDSMSKGWDGDELREPARARPHHPPRNHLPPKVPLHRRSFQAGVAAASGSFSSQAHEDYETDSILYPSTKLEYQQQEKMKLLRVIRELQDQIDKSCSLEGSASRRASSWKEKSIPMRYNIIEDAPMEETWRDLNRPTMYSRSRLGGGGKSVSAQQPQFSRMSFSGEAERQCLHCHPQEWKRSAPLPLRGVHPGYDCCNPQSSFQSRPQRYAEPEFSVSGDPRLRDHVMRKYKPVAAKKHFRPKAGGAPFVTCYHCSKLLQLPEDFLIFKRSYHKLKCATCSTVLKFSVQNRTHIIPYSPNDMNLAPPPSEADEYSGVMNGRSSTSRKARGYSDDFGVNQEDSSHGRRMVYASSFGSMGKRKELARNRLSNKYKDPVEAYGSGRPSSSKYKAEKHSSEFEMQKQQRSNSPLHRLMGYSSPSLVIRGTEGTRNA